MNFVGKFDAQQLTDGFGAHSHVHVEHPTAHAPADAIIVPDAHLLFGADFKRSGVDLILSNADRELVVHDYFKGEHRHPLASPDGAHLTGDIVNALAGHVEVAQAAAPDAAAHVIGHVTKLSGSATAVRNGVSVILNNGDNVEKGDVVATGSDSTLGVTFIDGTVFGLSSNARMVLNEMVYDPNGSNNSSLISLVAGTISFVAGETAKHGDMKVDTPVATMGIRGTAVLVEIDFNVPGSNGVPDAKFQVLVEPDGHTGSYILFDKTTLDPIATVNKAGQQVNINQNGITFSQSPLSPELQKLISDVFQQKFSTNDTNTKTFDHFTDSIVPLPFQPFKGPDNIIVTPVVLLVNNSNSLSNGPNGPSTTPGHIPGPPDVHTTSSGFSELTGLTGSPKFDIAGGLISYADLNAGDQPTASAAFKSVTYQDGHHTDITANLTPTELAAVKAIEVALDIKQDPAAVNHGIANWTYSVADGALDFLGANETLTLTYLVTVNNNFAPSPELTTKPITITITGTNDVPVITSSVPQTIAFSGGTNVPGGNLIAHVATSGTIKFDDPDLTDTHTVSVAAPTSTLTDPVTHTTTAFTLPPTPLALFNQALTVSMTDAATGVPTDSTGTGLGSISWSLAALPVWLADFIPEGEVLTLTYPVTVTDSQGTTATQDITITITGTAAPAEVWIATTGTGEPPDGLWSTGINWETGNAPTDASDAIIITNQLEGLTPTYPVTINSAAAAHSLTMDNFGGNAPLLINQSTLAIGADFDINDHSTNNPDGYTGPELDNHGTLTVGGAFNLNADAVIDNTGSITVTGKMEALDQSTVKNSGTIKLAGGGDFAGQSTISNTISGALIEVSGGTLNVEVDISNLGTVKVDAGAALTLASATIDGGTVTNLGTLTLNGGAIVQNGTLGNSGHIGASGAGNELDNEKITNTGTIEIAALGALLLDLNTVVTNTGHTITVDATDDGVGTLTLQGNSSITGGNLSNSGAVDIEGSGATLDGVTVTGTGEINVDAATQVTTTLVLKGATGVTDNKLTVGPTGILSVAGSATLDHVDATNQNAIEIAAGNALTLDDGTTVDNGSGTLTIDGTGKLTLNDAEITGGTINNFDDGGNGTIDVTGSSKIDGNATLNNGNVKVENAVTLTLDDVTVNGSTITELGSTSHIRIDAQNTLTLESATIQGASGVKGAIGNAGTIEVVGPVTLLNDALTNTATGIVQVDDDQTLTLSGTTITGGTINDASPSGTGGTIDVTSASAISNAVLNNGNVTLGANVKLTLINDTVNGTTFDDTASGAILQINAPATFNAVTINGGIVDTHDDASGGSGIGYTPLTIAGSTTFSGVQINGNVTYTSGGVVIPNGLLGGWAFNMELLAGSVLTLDNGTAIKNDYGTITIDGGSTLVLDHATIFQGGGSINNYNIPPTTPSGLPNYGIANGTIDVIGDSTLSNLTLNRGNLDIEHGTLTVISSTVSGTAIQVDSGAGLTLSGATIGGSLTVAAGGLVQTKVYGSTFAGTVINDGTIEATSGTNLAFTGSIADSAGHSGGKLQIDANAVLEINATDTQAVWFNGSGAELKIDTASFGGTIVGLAASDEIDLATIGYGPGTTGTYVSNADHTGGTLTITDGTHSIAMQLVGDYTNAHFAGSADRNGDLLITMNANDDAPVIAAGDKAQASTAAETAGVTGSSATDHSTPTGGAIHFTDIDLTDRPTATYAQTVTWSGGNLSGAEASALEAGFHLTPVTNTNNGEIDWTYSITDSSLDFLAAGETATVTSTITLDDHQGGTDTAVVTVKITGSNDAPVLAADTSGANGTGLHVIAELAGETGDTAATDSGSATLSFTDVDLSDTHTVTKSGPSYVWSGGSLTTGQTDALTAAATLALIETDSTHSGAGSIGFTYSAADSTFDFLAAGQTLAVTYEITVTDNSGITSSEPVTFTVTGSNDAPAIVGETNPVTQTIILAQSPFVLSAGTSTNSLGLLTETFDETGITAGSASNNGFGHGSFTSNALGATFAASGNAGVVHGSSSVTAPPFIGPLPGHADNTNYLSIGANGSETITFATQKNEFGLYWGSVDTFNTISFYNGDHLVASYSGANVAPLLANGNQGSFAANGYVEFSDLAPFTKVVLASGGSNAFEIDNISAGFVSDSHVHLAGPITGTITVSDADIGDTLTASVTGDAVATYNGSTTLPSGLDLSALIASGAITFDTVKTTGGQDVLDWSYNPANANLDFLEPGDKLTLTFNATVSDGHATTANQALTVTLVGNGSSVVSGTAQNDIFADVGGGVTISGDGGHDIYNFNAHSGSATITDFDVSNDVIDISSTLFTSVTALLNSAVGSGANTIITDSAGDKITLDHVSVAQLNAHQGDFQFTIANGGTFEAAASTSENVVFEGSTGKLTIDTPSSFSGVISGFTGDGTLAGSDQIDLKGIDYKSASFTESFDAAHDTLFVSDGSHSTTLHFNGAYQAANFSFATDNSGGTIVYDPPVMAGAAPGPDVATQAVTATGHGFVFNFADAGHNTNDPHGAADNHVLDGQTFASADPNKPQDDGYIHAAPVPDAMDALTLAAVKAQLHTHDFHFA